jgi:hypothetical protein
VKTLRAKKGAHGAVSLTIAAGLHRLPAGGELAFVWTVRSGGRVVARHAALQRTGKTSASYAFKPAHKGRFTLTGTVVVVTISGVAQSTSEASRSLKFRA